MAHSQKFSIGDVAVTRIIEREGPWHDPLHMYPNATTEDVERHLASLPSFAADSASGMINLTFQSFLLQTPQHNILIDTCVGEHEDRREGLLYPKDRWRAEFTAAGVTFEDIDYVFCTHMHVDHVGWNTRLENGRWVPTFPKAKYIFGRKEFEHWQQWHKENGRPASGPAFEDSVLPIVEAGRAVLVEDDYELNNLIHLSPAFGHTPGQCCANLKSAGKSAMFSGDAFHHPLQVYEPGWSSIHCSDRDASAATRLRINQQLADTDTLLIPAHFPGTTAGHVIRAGEGFGFKFIND